MDSADKSFFDSYLEDERFAERLHIAESFDENCLVSVTIPVRDEAEHITATLNALAEQVDVEGKPFGYEKFEVVIFANNCRDNSVEVIENFRRAHCRMRLFVAERDLPPEKSNIGYVRRVLLNEVFRRHALHRRRKGVLLATDADTIADKYWLSENLAEIGKGADAVGGRILMSATELASMNDETRRLHLADEEYRLKMAALEGVCDPLEHDPTPRHHQHFNGSFAVTAESYARAGGVPEVRFLEDCALFDALQRTDRKFRHAPNVRVFTSARHDGRSEVGLSYQLNKWLEIATNGAEFYVESPHCVIKKFRLRHRLREFFNLQTSFKIASNVFAGKNLRFVEDCGITPEDISAMLENSPTFGVFAENFFQKYDAINGETRSVPIDQALAELNEIGCEIDFSRFLPNV